MKYDYQCRKCTKVFEVEIAITDLENKKVRCPQCKSTKTRRAYIQPVIVHYKGLGFYITDKDKK